MIDFIFSLHWKARACENEITFFSEVVAGADGKTELQPGASNEIYDRGNLSEDIGALVFHHVSKSHRKTNTEFDFIIKLHASADSIVHVQRMRILKHQSTRAVKKIIRVKTEV